MDGNSFDALFSTGELQILKVLLPCLPPDKRGTLAIFIKLSELLRAMELFRQQNSGELSKLPAPSSLDELLRSLSANCPASKSKEFSKMNDLIKQMNQMREMMDTVQMLQELFPDGMNMDQFDPSMLSDLFPSFTTNKDQKSNKEAQNGRMDE